jgi:hypothetical protein
MKRHEPEYHSRYRLDRPAGSPVLFMSLTVAREFAPVFAIAGAWISRCKECQTQIAVPEPLVRQIYAWLPGPRLLPHTQARDESGSVLALLRHATIAPGIRKCPAAPYQPGTQVKGPCGFW